jgi:divalent metal cation (Fe/Co/Zn/Cd) transporter
MENLLQTTKDKISELTDSVSDLFSRDILTPMKEYGLDKLNELWAQIESATDTLSKTGYSITSIDVNLSLPPSLALNLEQVENISDEEEKKLLEENKENTFVYALMVSLFKANAVQQSIVSTKYKFSGLKIGMGLPPNIDMVFKKL